MTPLVPVAGWARGCGAVGGLSRCTRVPRAQHGLVPCMPVPDSLWIQECLLEGPWLRLNQALAVCTFPSSRVSETVLGVHPQALSLYSRLRTTKNGARATLNSANVTCNPLQACKQTISLASPEIGEQRGWREGFQLRRQARGWELDRDPPHCGLHLSLNRMGALSPERPTSPLWPG